MWKEVNAKIRWLHDYMTTKKISRLSRASWRRISEYQERIELEKLITQIIYRIKVYGFSLLPAKCEITTLLFTLYKIRFFFNVVDVSQ